MQANYNLDSDDDDDDDNEEEEDLENKELEETLQNIPKNNNWQLQDIEKV